SGIGIRLEMEVPAPRHRLQSAEGLTLSNAPDNGLQPGEVLTDDRLDTVRGSHTRNQVQSRPCTNWLQLVPVTDKDHLGSGGLHRLEQTSHLPGAQQTGLIHDKDGLAVEHRLPTLNGGLPGRRRL